LVATLRGEAPHAAVGWAVAYGEGGLPDLAFSGGNLTDGLTGRQTPMDRRWVGFPPGQDAEIILTLPPVGPPGPTAGAGAAGAASYSSWPLHSVAASFLAVPPVHFAEGDHTKPVARNITAWLPSEVHWAVAPELAGPWTAVGQVAKTDWWEREVYDIRTELYHQDLSGDGNDGAWAAPPNSKYLRLKARSAEPPWWESWYRETVSGTPGGSRLRVGRLMMDELIVNFNGGVAVV
jgi:hypothetical protein